MICFYYSCTMNSYFDIHLHSVRRCICKYCRTGLTLERCDKYLGHWLIYVTTDYALKIICLHNMLRNCHCHQQCNQHCQEHP